MFYLVVPLLQMSWIELLGYLPSCLYERHVGWGCVFSETTI